jgi:hypothetical protein
MIEHPKEIDVFVAHACEFTTWCESDHTGKTSDQMRRQLLKQLSRLYAAALDLPGVDFKEAPDPPSQDQAVRQRLAANLKSLPFQYYWEVFTPTDERDNEPVTGDLFDDLLDIYGDIAGGLWLYQRGHIEAAVFEWSFRFGVHWGRHVVSALHALHSFGPDEGYSAP